MDADALFANRSVIDDGPFYGKHGPMRTDIAETEQSRRFVVANPAQTRKDRMTMAHGAELGERTLA
jgi:hypothetical protein